MSKESHYDVILEKVGSQQLGTIKALCSALGLGLAQAKTMISKTPVTLVSQMDSKKALKLKKDLEALGNVITIPGLETKETSITPTKKASSTKTTKSTSTKTKTTKTTTPKDESKKSTAKTTNTASKAKPTKTTKKSTAKTTSKVTKLTIKTVTYENGDIYKGEVLDGYRHGKGLYTWANGTTYDGDWVKGKRTGFGIYKCYGKNEVDGSTYTSYHYEGEWKDSLEHGHGISKGYKVFPVFGHVYMNWSYDGMWYEGKRHGSGTYMEWDGNAINEGWKVLSGEWIHGKRQGRFIWYREPSNTGKKYMDFYEQGDIKVRGLDYHPDVKTLDDAYRLTAKKETQPTTTTSQTTSSTSSYSDSKKINSMNEYYDACLDPSKLEMFDDFIGNEILFHENIDIEKTISFLDSYFEGVLMNFEDIDFATAIEFLAVILQVDESILMTAFQDDGIFDGDEFDLFDALECAFKCAYYECVETWDEMIYIALFHFAYYLYKKYPELNGHQGSEFFWYYLAKFIGFGIDEDEYAKNLGALYLARLYEYDTAYVRLDEDSHFYELEILYGNEFDYLLEDNVWIGLNIQGELINQGTQSVYRKSKWDTEKFTTYTWDDGRVYRGYFNALGQCHGWGEIQYADGDSYLGFWENGIRKGFGIEHDSLSTVAGHFENGQINGRGFAVDNFWMSSPEESPIMGTYFDDGNSISSPEIISFTGVESYTGRYSKYYRFLGQLDDEDLAHGKCLLWGDHNDSIYCGEGNYIHGELKFGLRMWLYYNGVIEWTYGKYLRPENKKGYILYSDKYSIETFRGKIKLDGSHIELIYFDTGEFTNGVLEGKGTRIYPDGLQIKGYFKNGNLKSIISVIKPNGKIGTPNDYRHYIK